MKIRYQSLARLGAVGLFAVVLGLSGCKSSDRADTQAARDRQVAKEVKKTLAEDSVFKFANVGTNVRDGVIQLTGFAATQEERQRAAELASRVQGAREVRNDIVIKPTPTGRATVYDPMTDTNAPAPPQR